MSAQWMAACSSGRTPRFHTMLMAAAAHLLDSPGGPFGWRSASRALCEWKQVEVPPGKLPPPNGWGVKWAEERLADMQAKEPTAAYEAHFADESQMYEYAKAAHREDYYDHHSMLAQLSAWVAPSGSHEVLRQRIADWIADPEKLFPVPREAPQSPRRESPELWWAAEVQRRKDHLTSARERFANEIAEVDETNRIIEWIQQLYGSLPDPTQEEK